MKPVVDGLRQRYDGRIEFTVHETLESDPQGNALASERGVRAVPTMMLVSPDGQELQRWVGSRSDDELSRAFDEALTE